MKIEIKPLQGLGDLPFGAISADINTLLGEPIAMENVPADDNMESIILEYNDGISVFMEGMFEPIASNFDVTNPKAILYGQEVFRLSPEEVVKLMQEQGYTEIEKEEEEWGELRLSFEEALVDFYFEEDKLMSVNFAIMTNEKGEIVH